MTDMLNGPDEETIFLPNRDIYDVVNVKVILTDLKYVNTNVLAKLYDVTINLEVPISSKTGVKTVSATKVPPTLSCLECNKTFMNRHQYKLHQKMHEYTCKRKQKCPLCDEVFPSKDKLCQHMQTHSSSKEQSNSTNMEAHENLKIDLKTHSNNVKIITPHNTQISENVDTKGDHLDKLDQSIQNSTVMNRDTEIQNGTAKNRDTEIQNTTNMSTGDERLKNSLKTCSNNLKMNNLKNSPQSKLISEDSDSDVEQVEIVFNDIEFENKVPAEGEMQPTMVDTTIKENIAKVGGGFIISKLSKCIKESRAAVPATTVNEVIEVIDSDDETNPKESPITKNNTPLQSDQSKLPAKRIVVINPNSLKLIPLSLSDIPPLVPLKFCDTCKKCKTLNVKLNQEKTCDKCLNSNTVDDGSDEDLVIDLEEDNTNDTSGAIQLSKCSQQVKVGDISIMVTCVSCKLKMKPDQVQFISGQVRCKDCVTKKLTCFYCKVQFSSTDSLRSHTEQLHFCKICGKHYADISKHKLKQVPCIICNVLICKKYSIPRHYQSRHNKFWCSHCNSVFDGEYDLYVHIRENHHV